MRYSYIFCLLLLSFTIFGKEKYSGDCLLGPSHQRIPLYSNYDNNDIVDYVINDTLLDIYPVLSIREVKNNRALIDAYYVLDYHLISSGWIDISYLVIRISLSNNDSFLNIYSEPYKESKRILKYTKVFDYTSWPVIEACNGWLKIADPETGEILGWIPPENQCCNPFTTCG